VIHVFRNSQEWFYFTFTWDVEAGLRYFQNGLLVASTQAPEDITRASDIFTQLTVGKFNAESLDHYGNLSVSDLLIWRKRLTDDEVLHSYKISREYRLLLVTQTTLVSIFLQQNQFG